MAKKLSETEKTKIVELFLEGKTTLELAKKFNCTNLTIIRNLKKLIGEEKFKLFAKKINQLFKIHMKRKRKFHMKMKRNILKKM